jgi:hypothetical protein
MKQVTKDVNLVAFCGLYCGGCRAYLNEHCPGCKENKKAGWCKIRVCCLDNNYKSCAECIDFKDVDDCRKFNNAISKIFAFVFRSNRQACIRQVRDNGLNGHAEIMTRVKKHTLPR